MKHILILLLFASFSLAYAQGKKTYQVKIKSDVKTLNHKQKYSLTEIKDTSIVIALPEIELGQGQSMEIPYSSIQKLKIKTKEGRGRDIGLGAVIGGLMGAIGGLAAGDDNCTGICISLDAEDKAIIFGGLGVLMGGTFGLLTHKKKWTHEIEGELSKFEEFKTKLSGQSSP